MRLSTLCSALLLAWGVAHAANETPKAEPIQKVEVGAHGEFRVNGKPFVPLCSWLQPVSRYPKLRDLGFNVFVGNWQNSPPADEMGAEALAAGGYAIPHFDGKGAGHAGVFGWLQNDEPDLTSKVSDAVVTPGKGLRVNKSVPLTNLVDGDPKSSAVIDPMAEGSFTVELAKPVSVTSLAVWLPKGDTTAQAAEMVFLGDGKEILRTAVRDKVAQQKFELKAEATFQKLEVRILAAKAGQQVWGRISEIEAFDAKGANVLKSALYGKVRQTPEQTLAHYRKIKVADASRPVWLTLTVRFLPRYEQWHRMPAEQMRPLYPKWAEATDVLGTDIYPIYGFNKPEWLLDNIEAIKKMRELAGPKKPLYIWIETCNGGSQQGAAKVEPRHTRAEVWMSIIAGARGIGYFTHAWKPTFSEFACDDAMQAELRRLNTQVTRLTPAICGRPMQAAIAFDGVAGHLLATESDGSTWIFAQNLDLSGKAGKARITVEGLKAGTKVEVIDENRSITAADGSFEDSFDALAEHVYRIAR